MKLSVRADFSNIFNRTILATPFTTTPVNNLNVIQTPGKDTSGRYNSGFGVVNEAFAVGAVPTSSGAAAAQLPRQGTIVARIIF